MNLMNFQLKAIKNLLECMEDNSMREIILKSPTGSGKTIMLTHFMDARCEKNRAFEKEKGGYFCRNTAGIIQFDAE